MNRAYGRRMVTPSSARYLPFAAFMACIGLEELMAFFASLGLFRPAPQLFLYLYPVRIILVVGILYSLRHYYVEIRWSDLRNRSLTLLSILLGVGVFILWVNLDGVRLGQRGGVQGFNPALVAPSFRLIMIIIRVVGAVLVVPVMEELFWRSFLMRYLIDTAFEKVPLGYFTWSSFVITAFMFGIEHHLVVAGIVAGILYNMLLYRTKSLVQCILAHAVTNLALAIFVLLLGRWELW